METEYSSYTEKRASWLVAWLREKIRAGNVNGKEIGFAAISLGEAFPRDTPGLPLSKDVRAP